MKDILLTLDGDLSIDEFGDISLADSVRQAVRIRLLWFLEEWRFAPTFGVPYFESVFIKNPSLAQIRSIIRKEVISVDEVLDARNISIDFDRVKRTARITLDIVTAEETYREEVPIHG